MSSLLVGTFKTDKQKSPFEQNCAQPLLPSSSVEHQNATRSQSSDCSSISSITVFESKKSQTFSSKTARKFKAMRLGANRRASRNERKKPYAAFVPKTFSLHKRLGMKTRPATDTSTIPSQHFSREKAFRNAAYTTVSPGSGRTYVNVSHLLSKNDFLPWPLNNGHDSSQCSNRKRGIGSGPLSTVSEFKPRTYKIHECLAARRQVSENAGESTCEIVQNSSRGKKLTENSASEKFGESFYPWPLGFAAIMAGKGPAYYMHAAVGDAETAFLEPDSHFKTAKSEKDPYSITAARFCDSPLPDRTTKFAVNAAYCSESKIAIKMRHSSVMMAKRLHMPSEGAQRTFFGTDKWWCQRVQRYFSLQSSQLHQPVKGSLQRSRHLLRNMPEEPTFLKNVQAQSVIAMHKRYGAAKRWPRNLRHASPLLHRRSMGGRNGIIASKGSCLWSPIFFSQYLLHSRWHLR